MYDWDRKFGHSEPWVFLTSPRASPPPPSVLWTCLHRLFAIPLSGNEPALSFNRQSVNGNCRNRPWTIEINGKIGQSLAHDGALTRFPSWPHLSGGAIALLERYRVYVVQA